MNIAEFESILNTRKMKLERRFTHNDHEVYIADGYSSRDYDDKNPHFKTMYAYATDPENMVMGEFFTTPVIFPITSKHDRLEMAETRAKEHMNYLKEAQCLTRK